MEKSLKEQDPNDSDWGNPPSPDTPENRREAFRVQLLIGILAVLGMALPGVMFWLFRG